MEELKKKIEELEKRIEKLEECKQNKKVFTDGHGRRFNPYDLSAVHSLRNKLKKK